MSSVDQALAAFEPISLGRANDVAGLQTRIDRKYLVGESTLRELLVALAPTCAFSRSTANSRVSIARPTSTPRTSPSTVPPYRVDVGDTRFGSRTLRRHRALLSRGQGEGPPRIQHQVENSVLPHRSRCDHGRRARLRRARSSEGTISPRPFGPCSPRQYERTTLIDPRTAGPASRSTGGSAAADRWAARSAASSARPSSMASSSRRSRRVPRVPPTSGSGSTTFDPPKISKFCTGLATIHPDLPGNKWHRVLARHWQTQSAGPNTRHSCSNTPLLLTPLRRTPRG